MINTDATTCTAQRIWAKIMDEDGGPDALSMLAYDMAMEADHTSAYSETVANIVEGWARERVLRLGNVEPGSFVQIVATGQTGMLYPLVEGVLIVNVGGTPTAFEASTFVRVLA